MNVGEGGCPLYWVEPSEPLRSARFLRRYSAEAKGGRCEASGLGYHNAEVPLDEVEGEHASGDHYSHRSPKWPRVCACGYRFKRDDSWQLNCHRIYVVKASVDERYMPVGAEVLLGHGVATGSLGAAREKPGARYAKPGALWAATWMGAAYTGPDGLALIARCPNGLDWTVDGEATGGGRWQRTGDPRDPASLTVTPSIAIGAPDSPSYYHGFIQKGRFTPMIG